MKTEPNMVRKALDAKISKTARGFTAVVSAETLDRDGEVLIPQGCNAKEFLSNPTLFWNHDYTKPVGRCVDLKRVGSTLVGEFEFAQKPDGYEGEFFPEVAAALVGQGVVNAVSVGYVPEIGGVRTALPPDKKRYGERCHTIYNRWKLLEISLAPLQSNPDALITAVKKGFCSERMAKSLFGDIQGSEDRKIRMTIKTAAPRTKMQIILPARSTDQMEEPIILKNLVRAEMARAEGKFWID